jgi:hypothetical protein
MRSILASDLGGLIVRAVVDDDYLIRTAQRFERATEGGLIVLDVDQG